MKEILKRNNEYVCSFCNNNKSQAESICGCEGAQLLYNLECAVGLPKGLESYDSYKTEYIALYDKIIKIYRGRNYRRYDTMSTLQIDGKIGKCMVIPKEEFDPKRFYWEEIYPGCQNCKHNDPSGTVPSLNCNCPGEEIKIKNGKCVMFKEK